MYNYYTYSILVMEQIVPNFEQFLAHSTLQLNFSNSVNTHFILFVILILKFVEQR